MAKGSKKKPVAAKKKPVAAKKKPVAAKKKPVVAKKKPLGAKKSKPNAAPALLTVAQRDAALEKYLVETLAAFEAGKGNEETALAELLRYGARFAIGTDGEESKVVRPFLVPEDTRNDEADARAPDDRVEVLAKAPRIGLDEYQYLFESLIPGGDWSPRHRAKAYLLIARVFEDRYSDSLLNATARALEGAAPWHVENDPAVAMELFVWRARVLSYASYGETDVLPPLDQALSLHGKQRLTPEREHDFLLQACEALDRLRSSPPYRRSKQLLSLGLDGLELPDGRPGRARFFHAVADALVHGLEPADLDDATKARLTGALGAAKTPDEWAGRAWKEAEKREDGSFYGEVTERRMKDRLRQYRRGLAELALRRGEFDAGLTLLEQDPSNSAYDRLGASKALQALLARAKVPPAHRIRAVMRSLRRELGEVDASADWLLDVAVDHLHLGLHQLASLGAGPREVEEVDRLASTPVIKKALEDRRAKDEQRRIEREEMSKQLGAIFAKAAKAGKPASEAPITMETRKDHAERLARETGDEVWGGKADLLLHVSCEASEDGAAADVTIEVLSSEAGFDAVIRDPAVARLLTDYEQRLRAKLPGVKLTLSPRPFPMAARPGEHEWEARALTQAGAMAAQKALKLPAVPVGDLEAARGDLFARRMDVRMKFH